MKKIKVVRWGTILIFLLAFFYIFKPQIIFLCFKNPGETEMMRYRVKEAKRRGIKYTVKQKWVDYERISPTIKRAVVIAEDEKFWEHHGFDFDGIIQALKYDISKKKVLRGGSTITQQLAKNLYLKPKKSFLRKFHEAILATELELFLSKERILELYLNVIEWGNGIFGVQMASITYFGKNASELTIDESLRLSAVLPNPRRFSPVKYSKFLERRLQILYERYYRSINSNNRK